MKKFILLITLVIIFGGGYYFLSQSGEIIRTSVEEYGLEVTGSSVTLESAEVSLSGASLALKNLVIGNPAGFTTQNAFSLSEVALRLKIDEIKSENMHIESIVIESPEITYELVDGQSNVDALRHNIEKNASMAQRDTANGGGLIIDDLLIRGTMLNMVLDAGDENRNVVTLPEVRLQGIGTTDSAVTPAEAILEIMVALNTTIVEEVGTDQTQNHSTTDSPP